jgi:hypothetical protein
MRHTHIVLIATCITEKICQHLRFAPTIGRELRKSTKSADREPLEDFSGDALPSGTVRGATVKSWTMAGEPEE